MSKPTFQNLQALQTSFMDQQVKATHSVRQQKIHSSELASQSRVSMFLYCQKIPGPVLVKFVFLFFQFWTAHL